MATINGKYVRNPLQVFLPLAGLFLLYGLSLWVIAFLDSGFVYPGRAHADTLSAVFTPAVLLALLFQALPRQWGVAGLRPKVMALFLLNVFSLFVTSSISPPVTLSLFVMLNSGALLFVLRRVRRRKCERPGSYSNLIIALFAALSSGGLSLLVALDLVGENWWFWRQVADGIQFQGAPVLLLLGLSGELLRPHSGKSTPADTTYPVWFRFLPATAFLLTFLLAARPSADSAGLLNAQRLAHMFRAVFFAWIAFSELQPTGSAKQVWRHAKSFQVTIWLMALGMLLPSLWIQYRIAFEHMIFVGGYVWLVALLISESVSTDAAGGLAGFWQGRTKQRNWFVILIALGLSTRVTSDIWTGSRPLHLAAASLCVIAALIIWGIRYWKVVRASES